MNVNKNKDVDFYYDRIAFEDENGARVRNYNKFKTYEHPVFKVWIFEGKRLAIKRVV